MKEGSGVKWQEKQDVTISFTATKILDLAQLSREVSSFAFSCGAAGYP